MTYASEVLADTPEVYWRLGEPSGTTAADDSGNGHTGTYVNGPTLGGAGLLGGDADTAVNVDGSLFQNVAGDNTLAAAGTYANFTIEVIANVDWNDGIGGALCTVVDPAFTNDMSLWYDGIGNINFNFQGATNGGLLALASVGAGRHHIAGTYDGSIATLYIDGVVANALSFADSGALVASSSVFGVADFVGTAFPLPATGVIDEAAFYLTTLDATRIAAHAAAVGPVIVVITAAAYQWQLDTTVYGMGTNGLYLDLPGVDGLGVPDAKTQDVTWNFRDGAYANPDYSSVRVITIPAIIKVATEADAMTALEALTVDWTSRAVDVQLSMNLPGWDTFYVRGRPRSVKADTTNARRGVIRVLLRFDCPTPGLVYV